MHRYRTDSATFSYDEGMEGKLMIFDKEGGEVEIDAKDVLKLVAYRYVMPNRVAKAENSEWFELLE